MTNEQQKPSTPTSNPTATPPQNPQQKPGDSKQGTDESGAQPQRK